MIYTYDWLTTDPKWVGDLFKHKEIYIFAYITFLISIGIFATSEIIISDTII